MMDITLLHFTVLPSLACIVIELDEPAFSESSGTTIKSNVLVPEPSPYGNTPLDGPSNETQLARSPVRAMDTDQSLLPSLVRVAVKVPC